MTGSEVVKQPLTAHADPLWVTAKLLYKAYLRVVVVAADLPRAGLWDIWYNVVHENEAHIVANDSLHTCSRCVEFGILWLQVLCQSLLCGFVA